MVENRQKVFVYMDSALRATYGVADPNALHGGPLSYRDYLHNLLRRDFWGDEIVLWVISMMWGLKVMVLNSKTFRSTVSDTTVPSSMWMWGWSTTPSRTILLQVGRLFIIPVICMGRNGQLWSLAIHCSLKCWSLAWLQN